MAEQTRYQRSGALFSEAPRISTGNMPQLDFAADREAARSSRSMSDSLDRISSFAFKGAIQKAAQEGEQWGYQNPPTAEQIMQAQRGELDLATVAPKSGTAFGDSARKIMAAQVRSDLELDYRAQLANLSVLIDAGKVTDLKQVEQELFGMNQAYGKTIAQLDPEMAAGARASMAAIGNTVYKAAAEKIGQMFVQQKKDGVLSGVNTAKVTVSDIVRGNTDPVAINELVKIERTRLGNAAVSTGDPAFVASTLVDFDKNVSTAKVQAVTNYMVSPEFINYAGKPLTNSEIVIYLESGNAGKYTSLWATLTDDERVKVQDGVVKRIGQGVQLKKEEEEQNKLVRKQLGVQWREDFYRGKIKRDELITKLKAIDDIGREELEDLFKPKPDKKWDNDQLVGRLESLVDRGQLGEADIDGYAKSGQISWAQANALKKNARNQSPQITTAKQYIQNSLGIPDPLAPGFKRERQMAAEVTNQLVIEAETALQEGKPFNAMATAQRLTGDRRKQEDYKALESDKKALKEILKKNGLRYGEDYTDESLKRAGVSNADERKTILRRQRAVTE